MTAYDRKKRLSLVRAALGQDPLDLVIRNVQVLNVYSGELLPTLNDPGLIDVIEHKLIDKITEQNQA